MGIDIYVDKSDAVPRGFLVVDYIAILSGIDGEVLVANPFERHRVLRVLTVAFERLGGAISFDEPLHSNVTRMECVDRSPEATGNRF